MKKIAIILFAFFYVVLLVGMPLNIHYCMGMVKDIAIFSDAPECCCNDMDGPVNCCEDDQLLIQFQTREQLVKGQVFDVKIKRIAPENDTGPESVIRNVLTDESLYVFFNDPPPENTPLWLKNKNFIFYG